MVYGAYKIVLSDQIGSRPEVSGSRPRQRTAAHSGGLWGRREYGMCYFRMHLGGGGEVGGLCRQASKCRAAATAAAAALYGTVGAALPYEVGSLRAAVEIHHQWSVRAG
jgi:hypothetical protein